MRVNRSWAANEPSGLDENVKKASNHDIPNKNMIPINDTVNLMASFGVIVDVF